MRRYPLKKAFLISLTIILAILACTTQTAIPPTSSPDPIPSSSPEELWYRTRGEAKADQAWGVDVDTEGNIYTAGYYQSPASSFFYDMVIFKFDQDGNELWRTQWGENLEEKAFVVWVEEPVVYIGGTQHTSPALDQADMALLALDMQSGQLLWTFTWGQGYGYEEIDGLVADEKFIYLSGWTTGATTDGDIAILKINRSDGSLVWAQTWGTDKFDSADGQMVVDSDHIYVSGRLEATNTLIGGQAVIVKFSRATGEYLDHRNWGGPIFNDGLGMTSDGTSLYVVGLTMGFGNGGQIFLLKYDKALNLLWQQLWGGTGGESARAAVVDSDGNILIAGNTDSYGSGKGDIALLSYSPEGGLNWSKYWGGPERDAVQGIALFDHNVYLVGSTENNSQGLNDSIVMKADANTGGLPSP